MDKLKKVVNQKPELKSECFGFMGDEALYGESVKGCIDCDLYNKCYKMTMAINIQAIEANLDLITQNGLKKGVLKCFNELKS